MDIIFVNSRTGKTVNCWTFPAGRNNILQEHHLWGRVVSDPSDWSQVSTVMSRTMVQGGEGAYKSVFMKTLRVGDETVVVTYTRLPNGTIKISDGWVAK
ncbi:polymorphic toxin type 35 domain-containing protein [Paenibacillus sabuli]